MGLRYNRRIKLCKGVTLNLGKKGASVSVGPRGAKITIGKNGTRATVGIPGSGLSYTEYTKHNKGNEMTMKMKLPDGVRVPRYSKTVPILGISLIVLFILGMFNILFMLPAFILAIVNIIYLATSKQFKVSYYIQQAIKHYEANDLFNSRVCCNKALGIDCECKEALILVNYIIDIESLT